MLSRHAVNGSSFHMVMEVIRLTLPTCDEQVIAAICGFFECVVSQDEMQNVIFDKGLTVPRISLVKHSHFPDSRVK